MPWLADQTLVPQFGVPSRRSRSLFPVATLRRMMLLAGAGKLPAAPRMKIPLPAIGPKPL